MGFPASLVAIKDCIGQAGVILHMILFFPSWLICAFMLLSQVGYEIGGPQQGVGSGAANMSRGIITQGQMSGPREMCIRASVALRDTTVN